MKNVYITLGAIILLLLATAGFLLVVQMLQFDSQEYSDDKQELEYVMENGILTTATVHSCEERAGNKGAVYYSCTYLYKDAQGNEVIGNNKWGLDKKRNVGDQVEIIYFEGDTSWIYIPGSAPMGVSMHGFNIGFYLFWYVFSMGGIAVAFVTLLKKYGTKFVKQDDMILNYFREM